MPTLRISLPKVFQAVGAVRRMHRKEERRSSIPRGKEIGLPAQ